MADARVRIELGIQIYAWQWAVLEMMYDPATINRLRAMCGPRQLTRHAYPGQPAKRATAPVRPCSCRYRVFATPEGGHLTVPALTADGWTYAVWTPRCPTVSWFTINSRCPHHGDASG